MNKQVSSTVLWVNDTLGKEGSGGPAHSWQLQSGVQFCWVGRQCTPLERATSALSLCRLHYATLAQTCCAAQRKITARL